MDSGEKKKSWRQNISPHEIVETFNRTNIQKRKKILENQDNSNEILTKTTDNAHRQETSHITPSPHLEFEQVNEINSYEINQRSTDDITHDHPRQNVLH